MNPARLVLIYVVLAAAAALAVVVLIERVGRRWRRRVETHAEIQRIAAAAFGLQADQIEVRSARIPPSAVVIYVPRAVLAADADGEGYVRLKGRIRRPLLVEPRDPTTLVCDRCGDGITTFSASAAVDAGWIQRGDRWRCARCGACRS